MPERPRRRLGVYSLGFYRQPFLRRSLAAAGWDVVPGPLSQNLDAIGVWGGRPVAARGIRAAERRNLPVVYLEDAPLRSVTSNLRGPIMGLILDKTGNYLDASKPSDLENLLNATEVQPASALEDVFAEYLHYGLSKYNGDFRDPAELPQGEFVLVVDQLRNDASIRLGGADATTFDAMLAAAVEENPGLPVLIRPHPRAVEAPERAHFSDRSRDVTFLEQGFAISDVLDRASKVYCVTSQVGLEAIFRGHKPRVFGAAFYAGWGLSLDEKEIPRRRVEHSPLSLFNMTLVEYPVWFDVYNNEVTDFLTAMRGLEARRRSHRVRSRRYVGCGIRLWKRKFVRNFLGPVRFEDRPDMAAQIATDTGDELVVWGAKGLGPNSDDAQPAAMRLEDGFLRSVGLGAELSEPMSLCLDDLGIYYDPNRWSRLEAIIQSRGDLPDWAQQRSNALIAQICRLGLSKYNIGQDTFDVPDKARVILVPGQVEDDASIMLGTSAISTNLELLEFVRKENPDGYIVYKPHPDVEAGLRTGKIPSDRLAELCDRVASDISSNAALEVADEVWTMTSLMGFEALLRNKKVVCLGQPFYAGWGLTQDLGGKPSRRNSHISMAALAYASLIEYPLYHDRVTGLACPVETIVGRLSTGKVVRGPLNRTLSKVQGAFASYAWLWR